jgi:hypothetical protein
VRTIGIVGTDHRAVRNFHLVITARRAVAPYPQKIGERTQSSNQRQHSYVQDNVEVGFFTDPTVCIARPR